MSSALFGIATGSKFRKVRSRVEIAVEAGESGTTRFSRLAAEGGIAVRRTSPTGVHLVSTAAGPIGDDEIEIEIVVGRGATLQVRGIGATICLPGHPAPGEQEQTSQLSLTVMLHKDAALDCALPSLIVCRGSRINALTEIVAESTSTLLLQEELSLGRSGEAGGHWIGRSVVDVQGRPALRQTQTSQSVLSALSRDAGRPLTSGAMVSQLQLGPVERGEALSTYGGAMRLGLAVPGRLTTSIGPDLRSANVDLESLSLARLAAAVAVAD